MGTAGTGDGIALAGRKANAICAPDARQGREPGRITGAWMGTVLTVLSL